MTALKYSLIHMHISTYAWHYTRNPFSAEQEHWTAKQRILLNVVPMFSLQCEQARLWLAIWCASSTCSFYIRS